MLAIDLFDLFHVLFDVVISARTTGEDQISCGFYELSCQIIDYDDSHQATTWHFKLSLGIKVTHLLQRAVAMQP